MLDRTRASFSATHERPVQLRADRSAPSWPAPRPPAVAPAAGPRLLDDPATDGATGTGTELDLRPHPQRHDPGRARRRPKALPVSRHPRDTRPSPEAPGGEAQLLAFLGGY